MAFVISTSDQSVAINDNDAQLLFELPGKHGLRTPVCDGLWNRFYDDPIVTSAQVAQLKSEIEAVRAAHLRFQKGVVTRNRRVRSREPEVVARVLDQLLAKDPVLAKCDQIISLCAAALSRNEGLVCTSD